MGLFKTITPQTDAVLLNPTEDSIPTFRSRRSRPEAPVPAQSIAVKTRAKAKPSGAFDAFADRMASLRAERAKQ